MTDVATGGPLDGTVLGSAGPEQYEVRMADGTRHVYRCSRQQALGSRVCVHDGLR